MDTGVAIFHFLVDYLSSYKDLYRDPFRQKDSIVALPASRHQEICKVPTEASG